MISHSVIASTSFLARLCFRGIYFPMMGQLAWVKVIAQNRRTIFSLVAEAIFGRRKRPKRAVAVGVAVPSSHEQDQRLAVRTLLRTNRSPRQECILAPMLAPFPGIHSNMNVL